MKILSIFFTLLLPLYASANEAHVGIIVKKQGNAEVLTNPGKQITGKPPHVLFEGLYYSIQKARPGTKIENGNILRTGNGGKVRVVFSNGDQYNVGEGTAYKINWAAQKDKNTKDASTISVMYGSLRGIVSKKGPRSGLKIKTRNAVMGVRGTDFHIGQQGTSGTSSLSVLRGKVDLVNKSNPKKVIKVKSGVTAEVKSLPKDAKKTTATQVNIAQTSKQELVAIDKDSKIEVKEEEKLSENIKKEITSLEKKAVNTTLLDIKDYNPEMYDKLKSKDINNIEDINKEAVAKVYAKAPKKKIKADINDIDFDDSLYNKYFNLED